MKVLDWRPNGQPFVINDTAYELFQDIVVLCKMLDLKLKPRGDNNRTSGTSEFDIQAGVYSWEITNPEKSLESLQIVIDFIYNQSCYIYGIDIYEYISFEKGFVDHTGKSNEAKLQRVIDKIKGVE